MLDASDDPLDGQIQNLIDSAYCDFISGTGSPSDIFVQPLRILQDVTNISKKNFKIFNHPDLPYYIEYLYKYVICEADYWGLLIDLMGINDSLTTSESLTDDDIIKVAISWFEDNYKMEEDSLETALINSNRFIQESSKGPDGVFCTPLDDFKISEAIVAKILFQYIRSGRIEEAKKLCFDEAPWYCLLLEKSDSETWRRCSKRISHLKTLSNYEVALFGVLYANYDAISHVCDDWKDFTWAALTCLARWRLDLSSSPPEGLSSPELEHLLTEGALSCFKDFLHFDLFKMVVLRNQDPIVQLERFSRMGDASILRFLVHFCIVRGRDHPELLKNEIFHNLLLRHVSDINSWKIALKYATFLSGDSQVEEICKIHDRALSLDPKNGRFCFTLCVKYGLPVLKVGIRLLEGSESCRLAASIDWMLNLPGHIERFLDVLNGVLLRLVENEEFSVLPFIFEKMSSVDLDCLRKDVVFQRFMFFRLLSRSKESYDTWFRSYDSEFGDLTHVNFEMATKIAYEFIGCALDLEENVFTGRLGRVKDAFVVESCFRLAQMYDTMGEARGVFDLAVFVAGSDRMIFKVILVDYGSVLVGDN